MKKSVILLALSALAFAGCQKDVVLESNLGDSITIRPSLGLQVKSEDPHALAADNLETFNVYAQTADNAAYFENVDFVKNASGTYASADKYYWPKTGALKFYAYAPVSGTGLTRSAYNAWTLTQQSEAASQPDFIVALNSGDKENNATTGVSLNFRHAMSKVSLKVKNTSKTILINVTDWKLAYLYDGGTFALTEENTNGAALLAAADWTLTSNTQSVATCVLSAPIATPVTVYGNTTTATAIDGLEDFILIPQELKDSVSYADNNQFAGSYVAVEMEIRNAADSTVIVDKQWCCWPVNTALEAGKHYTFVVDLSNGGYQEDNDPNSDGPYPYQPDDDPRNPDDPSKNPDPVLKDASIKFVTVTVDAWTEAGDIDAGVPDSLL
ncbi:MAG: fimbrillin family protein [Bacteroidales bacterium]|nr:fimbrillin family protein [Bacteroidales bacterium]